MTYPAECLANHSVYEYAKTMLIDFAEGKCVKCNEPVDLEAECARILLEKDVKPTELPDALTERLIASRISSITFFRIPDTTMTICVLTMKNGFHVTGQSACASPENFSQKIGEEIAFRTAFEKLWDLEGYVLKSAIGGHIIVSSNYYVDDISVDVAALNRRNSEPSNAI